MFNADSHRFLYTLGKSMQAVYFVSEDSKLVKDIAAWTVV